MASPQKTNLLWSLETGESAEILSVSGSNDEAGTQRLIDIGFRAGQRVSCVIRPGFGAPRVFVIGSATYSLDESTASKILISRGSSA